LLVAGVADLGVVPTGIFSDAVSDSFGSAGSVALTVHGLAVIQDTGQISTLSSATDAGSVELDVESLVIRNGMITTAVDNISTPGGDIFVDGDVLVLDSGIIQANATSGRGGQIVVVPVVVASRNQFDVGGVSRVAFQLDGPNVIQAVRPEGVLIEAPQADISGSLSTLDAKVSAPAQLADNPCAGLQSGSASSLLLTGRGGLPSQFDETRNLSIESDDDAEVTFNEIVISPPGKSHSANGVEFGYGVECRG